VTDRPDVRVWPVGAVLCLKAVAAVAMATGVLTAQNKDMAATFACPADGGGAHVEIFPW
jgi:hypothetical protein